MATEACAIVPFDLGENSLLAALPISIRDRWLPHLESVEMPLGGVVYESGATQSHVYFPTTAIVSLLYVLENGASAEIAVVGNEGVVGVSLFMGGKSTPSRTVVQSAGRGLRREGVTEAALKLQHSGLIQYSRRHISVLDRAGLEKRTCECYAVVKKEYDRLLPPRIAR
jgi:hypothetical protein